MDKKFCNNCGAELTGNSRFCTSCGASIGQNTPPVPEHVSSSGSGTVQSPVVQAAPIHNTYTASPVQNIEYTPGADSKYEPVTTGGFIGIMLLMCIPLVGIILAIIWACGGCRKVNKRNLARAMLIMMLIGAVLSLILSFAFRGLMKKATNAIVPSSEFSTDSDTEDESNTESSSVLSLLSLLTMRETDEDVNKDNGDKMSQLMEKALEKADTDSNPDNKNINTNGKWPEVLPPYPDRDFAQIEDYRIEIYDTTEEEMHDYINTLKTNGYQYEDFLEFNFTEEDMLSMNGWWATDGNLYIGISYTEGTVILDYMNEKPTFDTLLEMME